MKIRQGFVSNSSSSSFVLIVSKKNYDNVYENSTPLEKDMMEWVSTPFKIEGIELKVIEGRSGDCGETFDCYIPGEGDTGYIEGSDPDEKDIHNIWNDIKYKLKKEGPCFYSTQNF